MNPFPVAFATIRRHPATTLLFMAVIAIAVALGVGVSAQERALRRGGVMAADRFDLIVAAPGSPTEVLFSTVFLRPTAVELLDPPIVRQLLAEPRATFVAPIGFGDSIAGYQVVGSTAQFVEYLSGELAEGRPFATEFEAVVGADAPFTLGEKLMPLHGAGPTAVEGGHEEYEITVVGRMKPTGNPWDRAVVVPVEVIWEVHGLPLGHPPGSEQIGPPFDPEYVPGLPALVVRPNSIASAYALREAYRTERSMAIFPAEVLVQLYGILGDIRAIMSVMAIVSQVIVFLAIFAGVFALMKLFERQFAVLRALGASRFYVFASVWLFASSIIVVGALLGLLLGYGAAWLGSEIVGQASGVALNATLGEQEMTLVLIGALAGIALATLPAAMLYRGSVAALLR